MSSPAQQRRWTEQEYLDFERAAEEKHEFVDGAPVAMAGGSREHTLLCQNLHRALGNALAESPCEAYTADMKVHVAATGRYRYPDASLACAPAFLGDAKDVLTTPCVIFEVLSPSTEARDRGEKFDDYRSIPTVREYVILRQHMMLVEHYTLESGGRWTLELLPAGGTLRLGCAPVAIPVRELYAKVL